MEIVNSITDASQLGTVDDVVNLIELFKVLISWVLPTIILFIIIFYIRRFTKRRKQKQQKKQEQVQKNGQQVQGKDQQVQKNKNTNIQKTVRNTGGK